jgi:hypothetical protein
MRTTIEQDGERSRSGRLQKTVLVSSGRARTPNKIAIKV